MSGRDGDQMSPPEPIRLSEAIEQFYARLAAEQAASDAEDTGDQSWGKCRRHLRNDPRWL